MSTVNITSDIMKVNQNVDIKTEHLIEIEIENMINIDDGCHLNYVKHDPINIKSEALDIEDSKNTIYIIPEVLDQIQLNETNACVTDLSAKTSLESWPVLEIHPGGLIMNQAERNNGMMYECAKCGDRFPNLHHLTIHMRCHNKKSKKMKIIVANSGHKKKVGIKLKNQVNPCGRLKKNSPPRKYEYKRRRGYWTSGYIDFDTHIKDNNCGEPFSKK